MKPIFLEEEFDLGDPRKRFLSHTIRFNAHPIDDLDVFIGYIDVRYALNEETFNWEGNIGYKVECHHRGKGYATEMLSQALNWCRVVGINYKTPYEGMARITCNETNIASRKVIEKNGGVLERCVKMRGIINRLYWIPL
jgi:predicted acetyltransferase